jgi:nicotinamidase-related amidase
MLIDVQRSMLMVCDLQAKLLPALSDGALTVERCAWLMDIARRLDVPVAGTEHYPQGLGPLVETIRARLPAGAIGAKNHFSAVAAGCLDALPGRDRAQVVLVGAETHVCVLQSALDLVRTGRDVFVVADCVASRRDADRDLALARMRGEGVRIVSREMVAFEWLAEGGTPAFRAICRDFLR